MLSKTALSVRECRRLQFVKLSSFALPETSQSASGRLYFCKIAHKLHIENGQNCCRVGQNGVSLILASQQKIQAEMILRAHKTSQGEIPGAVFVKLSSFARFHRGVCVGSIEIGLNLTRSDFAHFRKYTKLHGSCADLLAEVTDSGRAPIDSRAECFRRHANARFCNSAVTNRTRSP